MDRLLRVSDIQEIYGVSQKTVTNWMKRGMPVLRNGRTVRFKADEVEKWFRNK